MKKLKCWIAQGTGLFFDIISDADVVVLPFLFVALTFSVGYFLYKETFGKAAIEAAIEATRPKNLVSIEETGNQYEIVVVDHCQYIKNFTTHGWYILAHKGNCTNSIHIYNK